MNTTQDKSDRRSAVIVWAGMIRRCENPSSDCYARYGGRGITVCERWKNFDLFYQDMWPRPEGMTLERVDNDKGYNPENVKWATRKEQAQNRRGQQLLVINGEAKTMPQWAAQAGLRYTTVFARVSRGWSLENALSRPTQKHKPSAKRAYSIDGVTKSLAEWARTTGMSYNTLLYRLNQGWEPKAALETPLRRPLPPPPVD